jgi:hypothetical protein
MVFSTRFRRKPSVILISHHFSDSALFHAAIVFEWFKKQNMPEIPCPRKGPDQSERGLFFEDSAVHGLPPIAKTEAQLNLENLLQNTHNVVATQPAVARSKISPNSKRARAKPRLLLMGLRR